MGRGGGAGLSILPKKERVSNHRLIMVQKASVENSYGCGISVLLTKEIKMESLCRHLRDFAMESRG